MTASRSPAQPWKRPALSYVLVGLGLWGTEWCKNVLPGIEREGIATPVASVDVNADNHEVAQRFLGLPPDRCYSNAAEALANHECEFVIVVVPPSHHEQVINDAITAGVDILCEKPIAHDMAACCRVLRAVEASDTKMMVTMSHMFDQDKQSLLAAVESLTYGPVSHVVQRFTDNCRERGTWGERYDMPHPMLIEGSVHHFEILRRLAGGNGNLINASTWDPEWTDFSGDSAVVATIEMDNGVRCLYEASASTASTMNGWEQDYLRVECQDATLELDHRSLTIRSDGPGVPRRTESLPLLNSQPVWRNAYLARRFCSWLRGEAAPVCEVRDNLQTCALLYAAIESAETKQVISVQDFLQRHLESTSTENVGGGLS